MTESRIWEIVIELPVGDHRGAFEAAIEDFTTGCAIFEIENTPRWRITGYSEGEPDRAGIVANVSLAAAAAGVAVPEIHFAPVPERDWVAEVEKALTPIHVGPYYVFGSHIREAPPPESVPIRIDAGLAFGTGNHETTQGCLQAFERLYALDGPTNPIDVGTGSGILAIALSKRFGVGVLGTDIDPIAVDVARENARLNGVADLMPLIVSDGVENPEIVCRAPYDLVIANIVANPLIALAPGIAAISGQDGRVVLSGILNEQADTVLDAYSSEGLAEKDRIVLGNWTTLILERAA